ncbi:NAD(P)H:quinone oxidoreductase [Saccharibacter floricola]|uniref:NAD(P)H dehydrogenase (quinone) n=1 Tax=Saccharibacter floricola DSM 15669 TaxID=1123227 RepID=A0ABQ0NX76_9PROT|nr:NAD(P)H:quinone oxidoreductase [Saccharibacter floricola]GBQ05618.1 flavodoxin/nitric oxide synthase [Saccharibacter floricola DSM 15669]
MSSPRILILYYSTYGHVETMAEAIALGVRDAGAQADIRRVPELVPEDAAKANGFKLDQKAPIAQPSELVNYDGIIVGGPTRFGRLPAQLANFFDQTGGLWLKGALIGKVGAAFTSTGSQHGGQETTLYSILSNLIHHGMVITGLPYSFQGQLTNSEISGGAPYGATTIAGPDGSRQVSENERDGGRFLGKHVADIAARLVK